MAGVDIDVAVVGAGLSGIDVGYHIQASTNLTYQIYDARVEIGGTWSLFTFSGIRSDIDMYSYGFPFRPWTGKETIAEGWQIKRYMKDVAREFGIDKKINFGHRVQSASWSSGDNRWTLIMTDQDEKEKTVKSRFLYSASGYYNHNRGYYPELAGQSDFQGQIIHPQFWPEDLIFRDKKVVILGSGATTATLFPSMVRDIGIGSVTILQRSPSYYLTVPKVRPLTNVFRAWFPSTANWFLRKYYGYYDFVRFVLYRSFPNITRRYLRYLTSRQLPANVPLDPHFDPPYPPWHQRLCFTPDGDFFKSLRPGAGGHIVTATVDTLVQNGIRLNDGSKLDCDIIVQATGLEFLHGGSVKLIVDGQEVRWADCWWYRGHMLSNIPNFALASGSFFQGYTLWADIVSRSFVKLANHMTKNGLTSATPTPPNNLQQDVTEYVNPGYIKRGIEAGVFPKSSQRKPWMAFTEWFSNWLDFRFGRVDEDMVFA